MSKRDLTMQVVRGGREYSIGAVLFHRAVGQLLGVNVTDVKCLDIMTLKGSASPSELAEYTGLSTGATTAMLDRLENAGLIRRRPHPTDRRGIIVVLSKAAMRKLPAIFASLAKAMEALVSSYTEKELKILADFFSKAGVLWKEERQKLRRRDADRDRSRNTGPIPPTGRASLFPAERTRIRC
jgi:DNA-binding MarR family transcriptional regulator